VNDFVIFTVSVKIPRQSFIV